MLFYTAIIYNQIIISDPPQKKLHLDKDILRLPKLQNESVWPPLLKMSGSVCNMASSCCMRWKNSQPL